MSDRSIRPTGEATKPDLRALSPAYSKTHHQTYVDAIASAIENKAEVRNIALAGTYGSGKSSILAEITRRYSRKTIGISLLTLGEAPKQNPETSQIDPASTTNQIQKEVVKQLLYRQDPATARDSRFNRITRLKWGREATTSLTVGVIGLAVALAVGLDFSQVPIFGGNLATPPPWVRELAAYISVAAAASGIALAVRLAALNRLGIEKVSAGPATITLPPRSSSFFDEYLDEIIYFFEQNPKIEILIFEDLDRFDDHRIFESLRSLNELLNAAKQLRGRNFRFIYAIRDSVFENLGTNPERKKLDKAQIETVRANRTKFFELIIPVVPFITHKNARDLLLEALEIRGHQIGRGLIDVVARHVADMRLLHNVVNEYEIFKDRLLNSDRPVPGLTEDYLFAIVLLKNAHPSEFEHIRSADSCLDEIFDAWRGLINHSIATLRADIRSSQKRIDSATKSDERAAELGESLRRKIEVLAKAPGTGIASSQILANGSAISAATMSSVEFWEQVNLGNTTLSLTANSSGYYTSGTQLMQIDKPTVEELLGASLDIASLQERETRAERTSIEKNRLKMDQVRRMSWSELATDSRFTMSLEEGQKALTFRQIVNQLSPSRLVSELISNEFINSNFTLYASSFYGSLLSEQATIYVMRNVDRGVSDPTYPLTALDVESMLRELGDTVLGERSMRNVSILDYLIEVRPTDALALIRTLNQDASGDADFVSAYLTYGSDKSSFVQHLASSGFDALELIVNSGDLEAAEQIALFEAVVLAAGTHEVPRLGDSARTFVDEKYEQFSSLSQPQDAVSAESMTSFLASHAITLPTIARLSQHAVDALARTGGYALTKENLIVMTGSEDLSLECLAAKSGFVQEKALKAASEYLAAISESAPSQLVSTTMDTLMKLVGSERAISNQERRDFINLTSDDLVIDEISDARPEFWGPLLSTGKIAMTARNVLQYFDYHEEIDTDLAEGLLRSNAVNDISGISVEDREKLGMAIVNAVDSLPDPEARTNIAANLLGAAVEPDEIASQPGKLARLLLERGIVADDADFFESKHVSDWESLEGAISASTTFETLNVETIVPAMDVEGLMKSQALGNSARRAVLTRLAHFEGIPVAGYVAVADRVISGDLSLSSFGVQLVALSGIPVKMRIQLLNKFLDITETPVLLKVLDSCGRPFSQVTRRGYDQPTFEKTDDVEMILNRLKGLGIVSKVVVLRNGKRRAYLRRPGNSSG